MANNGHYYVFIFDRVQQKWLKLNDHTASEVSEEEAMTEAFGDVKGYKSAFLLFYISKQVKM